MGSRGATRWVPLSKSEARAAAQSGSQMSVVRRIILKWDGECSRCFGSIARGEQAVYNTERRTVRHPHHCKVATSKGARR